MSHVFKPKRANGLADPYWIEFVDSRGERHRFNVQTANKKQAENFLAKQVSQVAENKFLDVHRPSPTTFSEHLKNVLNAKTSLRSFRYVEILAAAVDAYFGKMRLANIGLEECLAFQAEAQTWTYLGKGKVKKRISGARVNRYTTFLFEVFEYAVEFGRMQKNPLRSKKFERLEEFEKIVRPIEVGRWRALEKSAHELAPASFYALMSIAFHSGMREANQAMLLRDQVDLENRKLLIGKTKNGHPLYLAINDELYLVLKSLPIHPDSPYVLADPDGRATFRNLTSRTCVFRRSWNAVREAAGVPNMDWHDFRHNFGSQLAMAGYSQKEIMDAMAHRSIITSARYMHWSAHRQMDAVNVLARKYGTLSVLAKNEMNEVKKRHQNGTGPQLIEGDMTEVASKTLRKLDEI